MIAPPDDPATAPYFTLAGVEQYLRVCGVDQHYADALIVRAGRADDSVLKQTGKDRAIVLTLGVGPGLTGGEQHIDRKVVDVRCIGIQGRGGASTNYDDAERFANDVDRWIQAGVNVAVGAVVAYGVYRIGGGPTVIDIDASRRVHTSASYIFPVASGL